MARLPIRSLGATVLVGVLVAPALSAGVTHRVTMESVDYTPKQLVVKVGDMVEWVNKDIVAHTATAKDRSWEVNVAAGKAGRRTMLGPGTFAYFCRYHPNMTAEITVEP